MVTQNRPVHFGWGLGSAPPTSATGGRSGLTGRSFLLEAGGVVSGNNHVTGSGLGAAPSTQLRAQRPFLRFGWLLFCGTFFSSSTIIWTEWTQTFGTACIFAEDTSVIFGVEGTASLRSFAVLLIFGPFHWFLSLMSLMTLVVDQVQRSRPATLRLSQDS